MKKTMMYLPEELHRYLAREAESRGTSMAEFFAPDGEWERENRP